jgi:hypothetical protein
LKRNCPNANVHLIENGNDSKTTGKIFGVEVDITIDTGCFYTLMASKFSENLPQAHGGKTFFENV